jgi:hypothetical protein
MARVVRVPRQNSQRPVDLLGQNDTRELMRQGNAAEGKEQVRPLTRRGGPTVCGTNSKHKTLSSFVAQPPYLSSKLLRAKLPPTAVQQNHIRSSTPSLTIQPVKKRYLRLEGLQLTWCEAAYALHVFVDQSVRCVRFGAATTRKYRGQDQLHLSSVSLSRRKMKVELDLTMCSQRDTIYRFP